MTIAIVTSGHLPFDERIFYKFGLSLKKNDYNVAVICSTQEINTETEGIKVIGFDGNSLSKNEKVARFFAEIDSFSPSLLICCEPLAILPAEKYRRDKKKSAKIIYDITEYYPHQNMLNKYSGITRPFHYLRFSLFNVYVSNLADYLFIGEPGKAKLYNYIAPMVNKAILGYYPPKKYFLYSPPHYDGKHFTLCFAGHISEEGGFPRYLNIVKESAKRFPDKIFTAKIIGAGLDSFKELINEISQTHNVNFVHHERVGYEEYAREFKDVDLCIDLRAKSIVFNRSLPIKIFDYLACGKPFIYSNLESLKGFEDVMNAGMLIEPDDTESILERITAYLNNYSLLEQHSLNARKLFEEKYNWELIEKRLVNTIQSMFRNQ